MSVGKRPLQLIARSCPIGSTRDWLATSVWNLLAWWGFGILQPNYPTLSCLENFDEEKLPSAWLRWKTSAERSEKKRIQPDKQGDHMPTFYLKISDGLEVQTPIDVPNA